MFGAGKVDLIGSQEEWTLPNSVIVLIILNALIGIIAFEWAWKQTLHFRDPIPELESLMPAWRRDDAKRW